MSATGTTGTRVSGWCDSSGIGVGLYKIHSMW